MFSFYLKFRKILSDKLRDSQTTGPILMAITIGVGAGCAAPGLRYAIDSIQFIFQEYLGGFLKSWIGIAWTLPVIALGGLAVGLLTKYLAPETKGHGVPEVMLAVARNGGRIRPRVALVKLIAAALTIGSGGSAGREGPIVHIGSALGSSIAQWLRLPDRMVILGAACGAAGGIAATFNAPMAGVMFALEVIVRRFTAHNFGLVVISSASATMTMRWWSGIGDYPKFPLLHHYSLVSPWDLFFFVILGAMAALAAHAFVNCLHAVEYAAEKIKIHESLKPALGGLLVGIIAIWAPQVMGTGYETIDAALNNTMLGWFLLVLFLAKMCATALTVGSGGSGGVFLPSLFIGAMLGGSYGSLLNTYFPGIVSSPGAYALVGMSVVFSAAAHAPITAILVLIEMTDNYYIIVPLMSATVMGTFISQRISKDSIYTVKLTQRGIRINDAPEVNLMDAVTVGSAMDSEVDGVPPGMSITELISKMKDTHRSGFVVLDEDHNLLGIVTAKDIENAVLKNDGEQLTVGHICTRNVAVCRPEQTLSSALSQFGKQSYGRLPVIDPLHPSKVIGVLKRQDVINACVDARLRSDEMVARAEHYQDLSRRTSMVIESAVVNAGAPLAGMHVRDAVFPPESTLGAIRRDSDTLVPRGSTQIQPGDELIVLTTRDHGDAIRAWLEERT